MRKILIVLVLIIFSFSAMAQEKKEQTKPEKVKTEKVEKKTAKKTEKTTEKKEAVKSEPKPEKKVEKETKTPEKDIAEKKEKEDVKPEEKVKPTPPAKVEKEEKVQPTEVVKTEKAPEPVKKVEEAPEKDLKTLAKELEELKAEITKMKAEKKPESKKDEKLSGDPIMFKPYGFIELYGWANDAQFVSNDLVIYVKDEKGSTANLSARNSRFGFEISVPYIKTVDLSAKLEVDFFGSLPDSGTAETSTGIRMRHAYFKLAKTFASGTTLALVAGQTWATATIPVFPNLINPAAGWGIGNPWTRIPLAELTVAQKMGKLCGGLKLAVAKPITGTSSNRKGFIEVNVDSGDSSHWPSLQGQLFLKGKFEKISFHFAAAGAYGREDYTDGIKMNNSDTIVYGNEVHTWIFNTALVFSHKYASVKGKFYIGENLDMFGVFGGSLITDNDGIVQDSMKAMGYWAELSLMPFGELVLSTGLGAEMPEDIDDANYKKANYKKNDSFWVAAYYTFVKHLRVGLQWQNTSTEYTDDKKTGNSFMGSLRFTF